MIPAATPPFLGVSSPICSQLVWLATHGDTAVYLAVAVFTLVAVFAGWLSDLRGAEKSGLASRTPLLLFGWAILAVLYTVCRLIDVVMALLPARHAHLPPSMLVRTGFIERSLLGKSWTWVVMPLSDHPQLALFLHEVLWGSLLVIVYHALISFSNAGETRATMNRAGVPAHYRITGFSTACGLDASVRAWLLPITGLLAASVLLCSLSLPTEANLDEILARCAGGVASGQSNATSAVPTAPGALALLILLVLALALHVSNRPIRIAVTKETSQPQEIPPQEPIDPLRFLRAALSRIAPGSTIDDPVTEFEAVPLTVCEWPSGLPPLLQETLVRQWAENDKPYKAQARILELVHDAMKLPALASDASRELKSAVRDPDPGKKLPPCDSVVLCGPEGSGRKTTLLASAMLPRLARGGASLLICRDTERLGIVASSLEASIRDSDLRWSIDVVRAGKGLRDRLATGQIPSVVLADLHSFEEDLLLDSRCDRFLETVDLVLVDEINEFTGPSEMHLGLSIQRLWLALEHVEKSNRSPLTLASASPLFGEASAWATSILGRGSLALALDGCALPDRALLRRRNLHAPAEKDPSLVILARACEEAGLPWHMRLAGDRTRKIQRFEGELQILSVNRKSDPREAVVVLLGGSYGEVVREIEMTSVLSLKGGFKRCLQIAVPALEEELALEPLGVLPWSAVRVQPSVDCRFRHLLRATHSRPLRRSALCDRLLSASSGTRLDDCLVNGSLEAKEVRILPRSTFQPVIETMVSRASSAPPLPVLDIECVTQDSARLFEISGGTTLDRTDASTAPTLYYPGAVILLRSGRFRVEAHPDRWKVSGGYGARLLGTGQHSTAERRWTLASGAFQQLATVDRSFGKRILHCSSGEATVVERIEAVRLYGTEGDLVERRETKPPIEAVLPTRLFLIKMDGSPICGRPEIDPVVAALSLAAHSIIRCARELLRIAVIEDGGKLFLAFIDRNPGGNGTASFVDDSLVQTLLKAAAAILQNLPPEQLDRLKHNFGEVPGGLEQPWNAAGGSGWLGEVVEIPEARL